MYISNNIADRIKFAAKAKGIPVKKLLADVSLGFNTMSNMKTSMPKADSLARIADYLECSVDYLLGRTNEPTGDTYLNSKEKKLITAYRNKPDMQKSVDILLGITEGEFKGEIIGGQGITNVAKIAAFGGGISTIPINENELDNEELDRLIEEAKFKIDEE